MFKTRQSHPVLFLLAPVLALGTPGCATTAPAPVRQGPIEIKLNLNLEPTEAGAELEAVTDMLASRPAFASDTRLNQAKTDGLIGEQHTGYLGLLRQDLDPRLWRQIQEINAKRRADYQALAIEIGTSLNQIAQLAGEKLVARSAAGTYVLTAVGGWTMVETASGDN